MSNTILSRHRSIILTLLMASLFLLPYTSARLFYRYGSSWLGQPVNHGTLLTPPLHLNQLALRDKPAIVNKWLLFYSQQQACQQECINHLIMLSQLRAAFSKDSLRIESGLLISDKNLPVNHKPPLAQAHHMQWLVTTNTALRHWLAKLNKKPPSAGYYIADPHGNVILYYSANSEPKPIYQDLKRLLKASRIG